MKFLSIQKHQLLKVLDATLCSVAVLMCVTDATVFLFHFMFLLLSIGVLYWSVRGFVIRASLWVTLDTSYVLHTIYIQKTPVDELSNIPLFLAILVAVYFIAQKRLQAEIETRLLNAAFEQRVAALNDVNQELKDYTQKLQQTQDKLIQEEKMSALGHLVAGIAHEINNPLGAIQASISNIIASTDQAFKELPELFRLLSAEQVSDFFALVEQSTTARFLSSREERQLRRQIKQNLIEQQFDNAEQLAISLSAMGIVTPLNPFMNLLTDTNSQKIVDAAHSLCSIQNNSQYIRLAVLRASRTIFALKNYVRHDKGKVKVRASIPQGIETILTIYEHQLKQGVEVTKVYDEDIPLILCYPDDLTQVWSNLIGNAIQAMDYQGELVISLRAQMDHVLVEIGDTGGGIPFEIQEKIFEPFFTTKPAGEGSGLGLHIVRKIIDNHGGEIDLETQPGYTVFRVWLPIN